MGTHKSESTDAELRAIQAVKRALEPLDRGTCQRVLEWAQARYIRAAIPELEVDMFTKFTDALAEAARQMGDITPLDIIRAASAIYAEKENVADDAAEVHPPVPETR